MDPPTEISDAQLEDIVLHGKVLLAIRTRHQCCFPFHILTVHFQAAVVARKLAAKHP